MRGRVRPLPLVVWPRHNLEPLYSTAQVAPGNIAGVPPVDLFRQLVFQFFDLHLGLAPVGRTFLHEPVDSSAQITHQDLEFVGLESDLGPFLPGHPLDDPEDVVNLGLHPGQLGIHGVAVVSDFHGAHPLFPCDKLNLALINHVVNGYYHYGNLVNYY